MDVFPPDIVVRDTGTAKGRGVFAARAFAAGEIVEECPVIVIKIVFPFLPNEIKTFVFNWGNDADGAGRFALALGYGSLYNHDSPANLRYEKNNKMATVSFIARRDIDQGEELTINYNAWEGESDCNDWFERHKIVPILSSPRG